MKARSLVSWLLVLSSCGWAVLAQELGPETRLYDTGTALAGQPSPEIISKRAGWRLIPEDTLPERFTGDPVVANDKLVLVFQKEHRGADVYSTSGRSLARAGLRTGSGSEPLTGIRIVENSASGIRVEARWGVSEGLRFRLTTGEGIVEIQSPQGNGAVEVQSDTRYVVVPDYFGDDMVYGSQSFNGLLPAENFCLNLLGSGDAILMTVWQSNQQDASLTIPQVPANGAAGVTQVRCLQGKSIWLAFLEQPGIWRTQAGLAADSRKPPFDAKWRSSLVRGKNVADSWDTAEGPTPAQKSGEHQGPLLTYLIDRTPATPLTATCPTDIMRNTLGVGPCQYILACEGMGSQGDPTPNSVMGWVEKQFQQKKQGKAADDIQQRLQQMTRHVEEASAKIRKYAELAAALRKTLAGQAAGAALSSLAQELEVCAAAGLTPEATPERAQQLSGQVVALIKQDNALPACLELGRQLRRIGAIQDRSLARCRMMVRRLRQEARTAASDQPSALAQQVQRLTEQMLQAK